jgi:hypothetical protein
MKGIASIIAIGLILIFIAAVLYYTPSAAIWGARPAVGCSWDGANKATCSFSGVLEIADQQSTAGFVIGQCYPNCKVPDALVAILNQPGSCTIAAGGLSLPATGSIDSSSCQFYNGNTGGFDCIFRVHMDTEPFTQAARLSNYPAPQQGTCTFTYTPQQPVTPQQPEQPPAGNGTATVVPKQGTNMLEDVLFSIQAGIDNFINQVRQILSTYFKVSM